MSNKNIKCNIFSDKHVFQSFPYKSIYEYNFVNLIILYYLNEVCIFVISRINMILAKL